MKLVYKVVIKKLNLDSVSLQELYAPAPDTYVRVNSSNNDSSDPMLHQSLSAWSLVRTTQDAGFESRIYGGVCGRLANFGQYALEGGKFGVVAGAELPTVRFRNNGTVSHYYDTDE
ncbi:MAG: hypothetical protein M3461_05460 [Pseudomonadota bacterium]|nr:hypothetical protein [Pseudomonadota bacterium]